MDSLPPNRIYCARCSCLRSISEFPFTSTGSRFRTCFFCRFSSQALRSRALRDHEERLYGETYEKNSSEKEVHEDPHEDAYDDAYNDASEGDLHEEPHEEKPREEQPYKEIYEEGTYISIYREATYRSILRAIDENKEVTTKPSYRYCSGCNQRREVRLLGRFRTCEICRSRNKKSLRQRKREEPTLPKDLAEYNLHAWVRTAGEEEVKAATAIIDGYSPLPLDRRRPLTVTDYIQDRADLEKLKECFDLQREHRKKTQEKQEKELQVLRERRDKIKEREKEEEAELSKHPVWREWFERRREEEPAVNSAVDRRLEEERIRKQRKRAARKDAILAKLLQG
jgi:hypothetical protein